jgi:hypothetical protein
VCFSNTTTYGVLSRLCRATELNHKLIALLRDLSDRTNEVDSEKIEEALSTVSSETYTCSVTSSNSLPQVEDGTVPVSLSTLGKRSRNEGSLADNSVGDNHGEAHVTASVGSNEDIEFLGEDLLRNRQSRETGYVGQNSEVQWLRTVQLQAERLEKEPVNLPYGPPGASRNAAAKRSDALHERRKAGNEGSMQHVTDATFYLDSDNIDVDIAVNPYELPSPETAQQLLDCYMETIHSSFPIIPPCFETQLRRFIESCKQHKTFQVPDKWRALMNVVFAVGAKHSHLIDAEWRGDERDHLMYMTRAVHLLGLNNTVMIISGPDLTLVQTVRSHTFVAIKTTLTDYVHQTAVLALYFLVIGHVSRSWVMIGISIRLALALGLHLRNEDPAADESVKEYRSQIWWSLHAIECLVSSITGRPPVAESEDCTVPHPHISHPIRKENGNKSKVSKTAYRHSQSDPSLEPGRGEASNKSHYLGRTTEINLILQKTLEGLYAPRVAAQSWEVRTRAVSSLCLNIQAVMLCAALVSPAVRKLNSILSPRKASVYSIA